MATLLPRGTDDLLLDAMVTTVKAFATQQAGLDPDVDFGVDRDLLYAPDAEALKAKPMAVLSMDALRPDDGKGGGRNHVQLLGTVSANLFCSFAAVADADGGKMAKARLMYLKDQVMAALFSLEAFDFGLGIGTVQRRGWSYQFEGVPATETEQYIVGGTLKMDFAFAFAAIDRELLDLETIGLTVAKDTGPTGTRWAGLYDLTGGA